MMFLFKKGNTLIEVMLGVAIAVVGLLAIVQLSTRSVSNSGFAKRKSEATALATKTAECIRNLRSIQGWSVFRGYSNGGQPSAEITNCCPAVNGYTCTIPVFARDGTAQEIEAEILITWGAGQANNEFVLQQTVFAGY